MQYVNDDMDDVFRKAAEGYPLDTTGADWNKVLAGLEGRAETQPPVKKKERRQYLLLLLLLPLGLLFNYYYQQQKGSSVQSSSANIPSFNSYGENKNGKGVQSTGSFDQNNSGQKNAQVTPAESQVHPAGLNGPGLNQTATGKSKTGAGISGQAAVNNKNTAGGISTSQSSSGMPGNDYSSTNTASGFHSNSPGTLPVVSYTNYISHGKYDLEGININPGASFQQVSGSQPKKTNAIPTPKRFYVGLMAGLDRTTIEFQKTSQNGFDYGALVGYRFGRKWSVEASAFMDKKYYYTEGKYYKNDGLYMPPNSWITDVDGYCRMWDLTLGANYSISQGRKSGWFATAGISSYIMKKEEYDYTYYYATSGVSAVHSKTYNNESKNLFSIVNLSMGYTHRLGKNTDLRLEPYTKLPVRGVGVGKLPMLSAGVHIGVTHKLF